MRSFGKFAPNKQAGKCPVYTKPFHVSSNPTSTTKGDGGVDVKLHTMDTYSKGGNVPGKGA